MNTIYYNTGAITAVYTHEYEASAITAVYTHEYKASYVYTYSNKKSQAHFLGNATKTCSRNCAQRRALLYILPGMVYN